MPSASIVRGIDHRMPTSHSGLSSALTARIYTSKLLELTKAISSRCSPSPGTPSSSAASNSAATNASSTSYKSILGKGMPYRRSTVRPRHNTIDVCSVRGQEVCVSRKNGQRRTGVNMFPRRISSTISQKVQQ